MFKRALTYQIATAGAALAAAIYWQPEIWALLHDSEATPTQVQTSARLVSCPPPSEHETLHITVRWNAGRLETGCLYMGSRGSYTRERR